MRDDLSRGMYWLGHPGTLFPVADVAGAVEVSDDDDPVVSTSLGGGRRARVSRVRAPRSWRVSIPEAHADDLVHLRYLLAATLPPYQWIDPWAQVTNVLTPEQSTLRTTGLALGGAWPIADGGWATLSRPNPAAVGGAQGVVRVGPAPIPPLWTSRPVTVSAHLATSRTAGAWVILDWLDAAGAQVGAGVPGSAVTGMDGLRRSTVTAVPPWGAVACRIGIVYAEVVAQPQVTWTSAPVEWDVGNGAARVLVHGLSRSIQYAVPDEYSLRRQDASFTVTEIGPAA